MSVTVKYYKLLRLFIKALPPMQREGFFMSIDVPFIGPCSGLVITKVIAMFGSPSGVLRITKPTIRIPNVSRTRPNKP